MKVAVWIASDDLPHVRAALAISRTEAHVKEMKATTCGDHKRAAAWRARCEALDRALESCPGGPS